MSEKKYVVIDSISEQPQDKNSEVIRRAAWLDDTVVPGAPYFEAVWTMKDITKGPGEHVHEFDEYLGFMSGDPDTDDLGCTVKFTIDGDEYSGLHDPSVRPFGNRNSGI